MSLPQLLARVVSDRWNMNSALAILRRRLAADEQSCVIEQGLVTFVNPYSYSRMRQYGHVLSSFDRVGIDGMSLVWLMRFCLGDSVERVSFDMSSLAPFVLEKAEREEKTVYLIGGEAEQVEAAQARLLASFPKLNIVAVCSGYFDDADDRSATIEKIVALNPDIVVAGMGTPLQETFLVDLWQAGWRGAGYSCGGFFHQAAKKLHYYPDWVDRLHLRWAYRIWDEPRLARRYGLDYPIAAALFIADAVRLKGSG